MTQSSKLGWIVSLTCVASALALVAVAGRGMEWINAGLLFIWFTTQVLTAYVVQIREKVEELTP